jgi:predicted HAD superfamily Cof-like phosphohydrolase
MEKHQSDVADFHRALDIPIGDSPALRRVELRCALIAEEAKETIEAAEVGDLVGAIDGLCDLIYVIHGAALEWGVDLEPFFAEVHRTNMAKVGGPVRPDGKKLKPSGWQPPDIAGILRAQIAAAPRATEGTGNYDSVIGRSGTAALGR